MTPWPPVGLYPTGTIPALYAERASGKIAFGALNSKRTVRSSTFFVPPGSSPRNCLAASPGFFGSRIRSKL